MSLRNVFGIYNEKNHKIICFLGIKFKKRRKNISAELKNIENNIIKKSARLINIAALHQKTFPKYKNKYQGKTIVLVGAGPTLNDFVPINDAIYVGCNRVFLYDKTKFDYLFSIDKAGIQDYYKEFAEYKGNNCIKFLGDQNLGINYQISESYINKLNNVERYMTTANIMPCKYSLNLESEPLGNFCTVSLQALQFILYTNPKKVYIVGIDCTVASQGHFVGKTFDNSSRNEDGKKNDNNAIEYYKQLKDFSQLYYPETEIICVNPVGLKGIFKEVYTKSYLEKHPEIESENIEILE